MKMFQVIELLTKRIPKEIGWTKNEQYGPYNCNEDIEVKRVLFCVTPTRQVIGYFRANNYDLLVSHHPGYSDVPHCVFHTALDCCEGGLNDWWRDALDMRNTRHIDGTLGWYGHIMPMTMKDLVASIELKLGHPIQGQTYSMKSVEYIKSVAVCSGLGGMVDHLALKTKVDCYIVGEAIQPAVDSGFKAYIEVGHTISERMGVDVIREVLVPLGIKVDQAGLDVDRFHGEVYHLRAFNALKTRT